jgi:predicted phosphodiesterase
VDAWRIACISDIHGNVVALDAVLADLGRRGIDEVWALGDLVALGPHPVEVLERLADVPSIRFITGNTDRYTVTGDRPPPSLEDAAAHPSLVPIAVEVASSFSWTAGMVTAAGWAGWLRALPPSLRLRLPSGDELLGVHADPVRDDGEGLHPDRDADDLLRALDGCDATIVVGGHTHVPCDFVVPGFRCVNAGSVSNPRPGDPRASYALLGATAGGVTVEHPRVAYDYGSVVDGLTCQGHPAAGWIASHFPG